MAYDSRDEPFDPSSMYGELMYQSTEREYDRISPPQQLAPLPLSHPSSLPYYPDAGPSGSPYSRNTYPPEKIALTWNPSTLGPPDSPDEGFNTSRSSALARERKAALAEVDNAKFSLFHAKVCFIAGIGFFVDAYDIFSINIASSMIGYVNSNGTSTLLGNDAVLKAAAPVGNFIGQLFFGLLADRIGRKRMYGIELIVIIIGAFGQALAANNSLGTVDIVAALCVWRFIMGVGIGGDYPMSSVITSEFVPRKIRGRMMVAVFACQGWGQLVASVVGVLTVVGFRREFPADKFSSCIEGSCPILQDMDRCWRILVGLGCVPAAIGLWSRLTIPESPRFTMDIERNVKQAVEDIDNFLKTGTYSYDPESVVVRVVSPKASLRDFLKVFSQWDNQKLLLGCAYSWFAIDVTFYGLGLNTDKFFNDTGFAPQNIFTKVTTSQGATQIQYQVTQVFRYFTNLCLANMFLSAAGLIPGYWVTFLVIDHRLFGRKRIQLQGFVILTVLFLVMAPISKTLIPSPPVKTSDSLFALSRGALSFIALLCLVGFFQNFGPNTTTFVIPGELFPTRYRSTCHGVSAASGKLGAIISQFVIAKKVQTPGAILGIYAAFAFTGILSTLLLPETRARTLEENSNEDQEIYALGPVRQAFVPVS